LNGDGVPEIVSAEFWGNRLTVISTTHPRRSFADAKQLVYNVIDDSIGHVFDIQIVDLNG
jgi:hypothetical protein